MKKEDIGGKIKKINNLMQREIEKEITKNSNLTKNQSVILDYIYSEEEKQIYQKDIEQKLLIRRSTATEILNRMEQKDLIIRKSDPLDSRKKVLTLTATGKKIAIMDIDKIDILENKIRKNLTNEEIKTLLFILDKIEKNLTNQEGGKKICLKNY